AFRLSRMLRLLRPRSDMPAPKGSSGAAIASTSAPRSARSDEQKGPGSWRERARMGRGAGADTGPRTGSSPGVARCEGQDGADPQSLAAICFTAVARVAGTYRLSRPRG